MVPLNMPLMSHQRYTLPEYFFQLTIKSRPELWTIIYGPVTVAKLGCALTFFISLLRKSALSIQQLHYFLPLSFSW